MELKSETFRECMQDPSWSDGELIDLALEMLESYEEEIKTLKENQLC